MKLVNIYLKSPIIFHEVDIGYYCKKFSKMGLFFVVDQDSELERYLVVLRETTIMVQSREIRLYPVMQGRRMVFVTVGHIKELIQEAVGEAMTIQEDV